MESSRVDNAHCRNMPEILCIVILYYSHTVLVSLGVAGLDFSFRSAALKLWGHGLGIHGFGLDPRSITVAKAKHMSPFLFAIGMCNGITHVFSQAHDSRAQRIIASLHFLRAYFYIDPAMYRAQTINQPKLFGWNWTSSGDIKNQILNKYGDRL